MILLLWLWSCISPVEPPRDCMVIEDNRTIKLGRCLQRNGRWELVRLFLTWPQEIDSDHGIPYKRMFMARSWNMMYRERFPVRGVGFFHEDDAQQPLLLIVNGEQRADRVMIAMATAQMIGDRRFFEVGTPPVVVELEEDRVCLISVTFHRDCYQPITHFYSGGHLDLMLYPFHFYTNGLEHRFRNFSPLNLSFRPFSVLNGSPACQRDTRRRYKEPPETIFLPEIDENTAPYCGRTVMSVENSAKWADLEPHLVNGTLLLFPLDWNMFPKSCWPPNSNRENQW